MRLVNVPLYFVTVVWIVMWNTLDYNVISTNVLPWRKSRQSRIVIGYTQTICLLIVTMWTPAANLIHFSHFLSYSFLWTSIMMSVTTWAVVMTVTMWATLMTTITLVHWRYVVINLKNINGTMNVFMFDAIYSSRRKIVQLLRGQHSQMSSWTLSLQTLKKTFQFHFQTMRFFGSLKIFM